MTAEEKSVLSLFMIGVLIVVGKVLAGGEPITPRLFIGRMLLGGFVSMVAGVVLVQFPDLSLTGLIESLSPSGRRRLSAELAKRLRQSQQRRVMAQKAPDGTPYVPRQQQSARKKTGRVKRKMFAKLITSRFLHIRASPEQASMEFYGGKSPKIASVHQFGLSEENRKDGKKIDYPARPLLGFTSEDVQMIEEIILAHLDR